MNKLVSSSLCWSLPLQLHSLSELEKLGQMTSVTTLVLEGNPFSQSSWDLMSYASKLRKIFPNLQTVVIVILPLFCGGVFFSIFLFWFVFLIRMDKICQALLSLTYQCRWASYHQFRYVYVYMT